MLFWLVADRCARSDPPCLICMAVCTLDDCPLPCSLESRKLSVHGAEWRLGAAAEGKGSLGDDSHVYEWSLSMLINSSFRSRAAKDEVRKFYHPRPSNAAQGKARAGPATAASQSLMGLSIPQEQDRGQDWHTGGPMGGVEQGSWGGEAGKGALGVL